MLSATSGSHIWLLIIAISILLLFKVKILLKDWMEFGSADLTYFLPKNSCFKLINIISTLGEEEGQGWVTKALRVHSRSDHRDMSFGERPRSLLLQPRAISRAGA